MSTTRVPSKAAIGSRSMSAPLQVPLVKRRVSGQISGMVGAYGNVGALCFLTLLLFAGPSAFFLSIGGAAVVAALIATTLPEPSGAEHDDLIEVQDVEVPAVERATVPA